MYNVNFKTELELYNEFRIINTIKNEKHQNVLTQLIKNYVSENKHLIENPEIQEMVPPKLPSFYGKQEDWVRYIKKLDQNAFEKMAVRINFFRFLLHEYVINKSDDIEFEIALRDTKFFKKSDDYKFLSNGIFTAVQERKPVL